MAADKQHQLMLLSRLLIQLLILALALVNPTTTCRSKFSNIDKQQRPSPLMSYKGAFCCSKIEQVVAKINLIFKVSDSDFISNRRVSA